MCNVFKLCLALLFCVTAPSFAQVSPDAAQKAVVPNFSTCATPVYPAAALERKAEGTTTMAFQIGKDGSVRASRMQRSSGHPDLDDAARTALSKCHYRAALLDGKPAETWTMIAYVWTLDGLASKPADAP